MLVEVTFILFSKRKLAQVYYLASQIVLYATSTRANFECLLSNWTLGFAFARPCHTHCGNMKATDDINWELI